MEKKISVRTLQAIFLLFHIGMVAYAALFLHPYYASNDEFTLAAIASGAYGSYTTYFIYLHSGFAWILKLFYTLFPWLNCYTLVMYGVIFLSLSSIGCIWIKKSPRSGFIMSLMLILCSLSPLYVELQYTKTAAVATAAGYVLVFFSGIFGTVLGVLLLLLGSWIRFQAFGMVSILAFGFWLGRAVPHLLAKQKDWKQFICRECMPCVIAFALVFGSIALENVVVYTPGSPEAHYKEYDKARQDLLDYGVPEWEDYQAQYEALGMTRTDYLNLKNWLIADSDRYTADTFKAIVAFRQARPFQWEYLADYLINLVTKPLFLLGLLATFLWLFLPGRKRKEWLTVFWPYAALLGIYLYFIKIYRVLPIVVTACLLAFLVFVWTAAQERMADCLDEKLAGRRLALGICGGIIITGGLCVNMLVKPLFSQGPQESEVSQRFRRLYDTLSQEKEIYFVFDPYTNNGMELGYSIFEKIPENYLTNIFSLGGWETESPQVLDNLEEYQQYNLFTSLYQSDRAVFISDTMLEHVMLHLQDIYDGIFITYSKVNEVEDFDLFSLSYLMPASKFRDDCSAVLDNTYTEENERYDVFEGSIDLPPEELDGKTVFLRVESNESGKVRTYQGVWMQQDEQGLYSMIYDQDLENTNQMRFTIQKMEYPLDERYTVNVILQDEEHTRLIETDVQLKGVDSPDE